MVHDVTTNDIHYHEYCVKKGKYFKSACSNCVVKMKSLVQPVQWSSIMIEDDWDMT